MKKIIDSLYVRVIFVVSLMFLMVLIFWAGRFSHEYPNDYQTEKVLVLTDSVVSNIIWFLAGIALLWLAQKLFLNSGAKNARNVEILAIAEIVAVGILLCIWIGSAHVVPRADQSAVYDIARELSKGNYAPIQSGDYVEIYPHQFSMIFVFDWFMRLTGQSDVQIVQYVNILFIVLAQYFGFKLVNELFHNQVINLYYEILSFFFLPVYFYSTYVYGDILSLPVTTLGCWLVVKCCKTQKLWYHIFLVVLMTMGITLKKNSYIFLIAFAITLFVHAVYAKRWWGLVTVFFLISIPFMAEKEIIRYYERKADIEIGEGLPSIMWIAMGMQKGETGAGFFNPYPIETFVKVNKDSAACAELGKRYITYKMGIFIKNPAYMLDFYSAKLASQWNDYSFGSVYLTGGWEEEAPVGIAQRVYVGDLYDSVMRFMDRYIFLLYLCAAAGVVYLLFHKGDYLQCLPLLAMMGGVMFSILWEAKGRYVMPYVYLLIPIAAVGAWSIQRGLEIVWIKWVKGRIHGG